MAEVAIALCLPNACKAAAVTVTGIGPLAGRSTTATIWLENGIQLFQFAQQPAQLAPLKAQPRSYLFQVWPMDRTRITATPAAAQEPAS